MKRFMLVCILLSLCSCASDRQFRRNDIVWFASFFASLAVWTVSPVAGGFVGMSDIPINWLLDQHDRNEFERMYPTNEIDNKQ